MGQVEGHDAMVQPGGRHGTTWQAGRQTDSQLQVNAENKTKNDWSNKTRIMIIQNRCIIDQS